MEANDLQVRAIARALGRSEQSVTWKLKDLDIPAPPPPQVGR